MSGEFRKNAEDIESGGSFSSATKNAIAESLLIDHPDGSVELVADRLDFSLLVGQFEAMEARGELDAVKYNEAYGPNRKSMIFSEGDADFIRRSYEQCKEYSRAYKDLLEQRGGPGTLVQSRKQPGQGI